MDEHDDDLESTVVEGEEVEQDAFNADEESIASGEEEAPDDETPPVDDAEL